ncbi:MAG: GTPase domain-containing protein [Selenomonadaceae bacterium]|nr:GTPase domain-containing protein [Selenomonadaceae bacterium]
MEKFQLSEFTRKGTALLEKIRREFKILNLDDSALPKNFGDDDAIKLVFVGQYGAGKSSLIKMLTDEEVSIGADITTQTAQSYSWVGLEIIDTPGIHTELHPDHDEITYEQINHAALLIFAITSEGFSRHIGEHFRKLAVEQKRADNMILVVNKMDKTAMGNDPAQREIIAADLEKVTQPYKPQDLFLSFVSTANYFDALDEPDAEIKNELLELSGRDIFVDNLNRFAESHRLLAKISKPLYTTAQVLRDAINANSAGDDKDISEFLQTIQDRKNLLLDGRRQCLRDVRDIAAACRNEIVKLGREAASAV